MARTPSYPFTALLLRQNSRIIIQNPHTQIRNICRGEEIVQNQDKPISTANHTHRIAKEVAKVIRTRPRWEQTLLSDFPIFSSGDPDLVSEIFRHQTNVFHSMRFLYWLNSQCGFLPDQASCNLIFRGLLEAKAANAATDFLGLTKFSPEPACLESYVRCLGENGLIDEACDVINQLLKLFGSCPSLETWNSVLRCSVQAGWTDAVWKLYGEMMECGVVADVDTVECLIQAFCIDNKVSKGYDLLRQVSEAGNIPSVITFNKLISGFCKDKRYSRVSSLLHSMIAMNRAPNIFTYHEIIHKLCKTGMQREAFWIFNDLKDRGYAPDRVMYTTMIYGFCRMKRLGDAQKLWFEMTQKGMPPNEYSYCTFIYGLCRIGHIEEAKKLYKEMCDRGYRESTVSYNTMLYGLCLHGRTEEAHDLFEQMPQKGIARDVITYNYLIKGFCKEGKIGKCKSILLELLEQEDLQPSTASYTVLIQKLSATGCVQEAITWWKNMQHRSVEPATCTHDFIISGLSKEGYVTEGMEWLVTMLNSRLMPQRKTFEILIQSLSQRDRMGDALLVLDYMLKVGYPLSDCICHSLVNELCKGNSSHVGTCIGNILEEAKCPRVC